MEACRISEVRQRIFSTPAEHTRHHFQLVRLHTSLLMHTSCTDWSVAWQARPALLMVHSLTHALVVSSTLFSLRACSVAQLAASHNCQSTCLVGSVADGSEDIADDALVICNRRFHVVTAVLMLLRMLEGYAAFQECVLSHASEAARRAIELLKVGPSGSLGSGSWPPGLLASTCQRGCHAGLQAAWAHFVVLMRRGPHLGLATCILHVGCCGTAATGRATSCCRSDAPAPLQQPAYSAQKHWLLCRQTELTSESAVCCCTDFAFALRAALQLSGMPAGAGSRCHAGGLLPALPQKACPCVLLLLAWRALLCLCSVGSPSPLEWATQCMQSFHIAD